MGSDLHYMMQRMDENNGRKAIKCLDELIPIFDYFNSGDKIELDVMAAKITELFRIVQAYKDDIERIE